MFLALKSEIRKLLTVRSTYVVFGLAILLVGFISFYAVGWRASQAALLRSDLIQGQIEQAVLAVALLGSIVGVLLVTHEYRYNTIVYTLAAAGSRTKTFFAKLIAVTLFALVFSVTIAIVAPLLTELGIHMRGLQLAPQNVVLGDVFWKVLFVGWGYAMLSFIFAMIVRVQVGAISAMFLVPAMLEQLMALALKRNAIFLPYSALQSLLQPDSSLRHISPAVAVLVVLGYLLVGWIVAWQLFLRRDAQ